MNDTLATINVEQLSSAVNAVVQSTAIGQVPLDPSPPPAAGVPPPRQEGGSLTLPHGGTTRMVQACASHCGRPTGLRTVVPVPTEMSIPVTAVPSSPVTVSLPTTQQSATLPNFHTQVKQRSKLNGPLCTYKLTFYLHHVNSIAPCILLSYM